MTNKITKKIVGFAVRDPKAKQEEIVAPAVEEQESSVVHMNESLARPEMLVGSTYKIKPGGMEHAMYVTINDIILNEDTEHEVRRPFEIFINSKSMDEFQWIVALTRIMSAVFRKGGDVAFLVEELKAVFDPKGGYWKPGTGVFVPSVIAEIGMVVEDHLQRIGLLKKEGMSAEAKALIEEKRQQAMAKASPGVAVAPVSSAADSPVGKDDDSSSSDEATYPPGATQCNKCYQKAVVILDGCATCLSCGNSKCG